MKRTFLDLIPLTMFVMFAVFWSAWDMKLGVWTGLASSGLIICMLLGTHDRSGTGRRP